LNEDNHDHCSDQGPLPTANCRRAPLPGRVSQFLRAAQASLRRKPAQGILGGSSLGRYLAGFLAVFWGLRVLLQLFFYDAAIKKQFPIYNVLFLSCYSYLAGLFTLVALFYGHQ
jgi:hypothetical protein